jgi:hypothetical protein
MSSLITKASAATRSSRASISLTFEPESGLCAGVVFIRTQDGVFFFESPFGPNCPDLRTILLNTCLHGCHSPRPYQLGQKADESVHSCVFALFHDLCQARGVKAAGIARVAYPYTANEYSEDAFKEIVAQASWEAYVAPDQWDAMSIMMLYKALDDIGHSRVRKILESVLALPRP